MNNKLLVRYNVEFGRMGDLEGLFVTTHEEMTNALGKQVYWGEVLGKHSEIYHDLQIEELTIVTDDQDFIANLVLYVGSDISGFNPIAKIAEQELENGEEEDDEDLES